MISNWTSQAVLPLENSPVSAVFSHLDKGTLEGTLHSSTTEQTDSWVRTNTNDLSFCFVQRVAFSGF